MISRVPQPPLLALAAHKAPHLIPLSLLYLGCHRWQSPLCYAMSSPLPMLCQGEDHRLLWAWYATLRLASKRLALPGPSLSEAIDRGVQGFASDFFSLL